MKKFTLALDLVDDPELIAAYETWHKEESRWPEITDSIKNAGILNMEIYRTGNRLVMLMETTDEFSFEKKSLQDAANPKVQEWEQLMWNYQQALPWAREDEKWIIMNKIFSL
ncbi:L-rhamnose mutarotase [Chitinophaga jiangningensis]|uniref:L-rhamnose mutarotase n=1 Tax=Chitinophaga jiangningensis TaxID=1419482 RepID=A0A1M7JTB4_9BACT|nr:L-rhamnose mutarotase [Chitinophaga jiangningensis]SHM56350.1 L-rhamnose mutarotase [Chitinophaga jiangningensis]